MLLAGLAALQAGCATSGTRRAVADVLLPPSDEVKLGTQVRGEILRRQKPLADPAVQAYVQQVGTGMLALADGQIPREIHPRFTVLESPMVNAFAIPGGDVFVYSGLLAAVENEAELASVLAHELGHVAHRDVAQAMVSQLGVEAVASLVLGNNPGLMERLGATVAAQGYLLHNSREAESGADRFGMSLMVKSPYDPHAMIVFFEDLAKSSNSPTWMAFLSDHPAPADRAKALEVQLKASGRTGGALNAERLATIQQRLPAHAAGKPRHQG